MPFSLCVSVFVLATVLWALLQIHTLTPMCPAIDLEMTGLLAHTICSANEERRRGRETFSQSVFYLKTTQKKTPMMDRHVISKMFTGDTQPGKVPSSFETSVQNAVFSCCSVALRLPWRQPVQCLQTL